jgi:hypothetical protein
MHHPADDTVSNASPNETFESVLRANLQRRQVLHGGLGAAAIGFLGAPALADARSGRPRPRIGFDSIPISFDDDVKVPEGYTARVLIAWGDPLSDGPAFAPDASNSADDQERQLGMHVDGMHYFPLVRGIGRGSRHGLLVVNSEYTDDGLLHVGGFADWSAEKVRKSQAGHGVNVVEIAADPHGNWRVVRPSSYARRLTAYTPMDLTGPAAGAPALRTAADATGRRVLGTANNCAHGYTPWGTYLACEENWNGYFVNPTGDVIGVPSQDQKLEILAGQSRYGITRTGFGYRWHEFDERWDASRHPNEPNRFGYVVEFDPYDPNSVPKKRTALGRIKHEGAWVTLAPDGRVVVYMGDDERFEYIYKFVSHECFDPKDRHRNMTLLDHGTLYVAKFHADGTGDWIPLVFGGNGLDASGSNPRGIRFQDQADVLIRTRQAGDAVGATRMDRPEWIAVHPRTGEVYCTLTNNSRRGSGTNPGADAANPRNNNIYGHIIRWRESDGDNASPTFEWDIFVQAGDPAQTAGIPTDPAQGVNGDLFGSPDGLWFDRRGKLWIQTDVSVENIRDPLGNVRPEHLNIGHNQMLCADVETREIRRFLTGPRGCEVTGVITTPDLRTMFVGIQHPGEPDNGSNNNDPANPKRFSSWPDGPLGGRPRSAVVIITKDDGGIIGS